MSLSYLTLTLDLFDGSGHTPPGGAAAFAPSATLTDAGVEIVTQGPVPASFTGGTPPTASLLPTDTPGLQPSGWTWGITYTGVLGNPGGFSFFLPAGPQSFSATSASPAVFTVTGTAWPSGLAGVPNGTGVQLAGGSLPSGFSAGTTYYVVSASGTTFSLAATPNGTAITSTSTGSGTVAAVSYNLSALAPVASGTSFQAYMPLPTGTAGAGQVPAATGAGQATAWTTLTATLVGADAAGAAAAAQATAEAFATTAVGTETTRAEAAEALLAPLASPALTGTPTAPTKPALTSNTDIATTAYADNAVSVETSRAEAAEALALPLAGGTMSGAIAMGNHKITGGASGTAATDFATFGQLPSSSSPLALASGGTGASAGSTTALLDSLGALDASENLADLNNATTARTSLGLGSAATQNTSAFDPAGAATTAAAYYLRVFAE